MDQSPNNEKPSKTNNYQYQWLSPLRDIQPDISGPEILNIDGRWLSPLRDIQPSIFGTEATSNIDDDPMSRIDSTLFNEGAPQTSVNTQTLAETSYSNDVPVSQLFHWPTMSGYVLNPTTNGISRLTGTDWPNPRDAQTKTTETNKSVPSTNTAYPQTSHQPDPIQKDREPIRYHRHTNGEGDHNTTKESNIGLDRSQADFQRRQQDQRERITSDEDYPYTTQYRERLQAKASRQITNPMAPIGTPATPTGPEIKSTNAVDIPRRPRKVRSPIRFPSPDEDEQHNSSRETPKIHARLGNQKIIQRPRSYTEPNHTFMDQEPRTSHNRAVSDVTGRKRMFHNQTYTTDKRNQNNQRRDQQTENDVSKFFASIANDVSQIIENSCNGERSFKKKPRQLMRRQHDAKGVSNFQLDDYDQIVRTSSGHPRCNYCFIASHPRTGCKFRQYDLSNNIDRAVHPKKGLLSYKNFREQFEQKTPEVTLDQLPAELIEKIGEYLSFKERCKFGATNTRIQLVLTADKFWRKISLPNQTLKYETINKIIKMGTHSLSIPWSTINGEYQDMDHLDDNISAYTSKLRQLNISGVNGSDTVRGNNKIVANLVAKSTDLRSLDMTGATLNLLSIVAVTLPGGGHMLSSLNLSIVGNNNHHNFVRRYETMKRIIDKLPCLKNIILAGTNLCRKTISYICTYISPTMEKFNIAGERVRDSDLRALTFRCPNITFLNLNDTLVTFESFYDLATTWKHSMRYLSLPKKIAKELGLSLEAIKDFQYLEDLTQMWKRGIVNPRETPALATLAQFKTTIDSMPALKYLNVGKYAEDVIDEERNYKHTLQRLFRNVTINLSPYDDKYPVEEDPCSVFQEGFVMNTDIQSNPSLSPTSTASTILMEDIGF